MDGNLIAALDPISRALEEVRQAFVADTSGSLADSIPQLSKVDPKLFGISLASREGVVYSAGDAKSPFTIQAAARPFVHALALADHGLDDVLARVGAKPGGDDLHEFGFEEESGRPANPMTTGGAIVTTSLVNAADAGERFERIRVTLSAFAGRELKIDNAVYQSGMDAGGKHRALADLMYKAGSLRVDVEETLDVYFRLCAVRVTTRDLAMMAATLANGGVNPDTFEPVVSCDVASYVLTVMGAYGMGEMSGEWLLRVGLPATSGVSGALIAAKPALFGIGMFSPLLDERGHSVRAMAACRELAERFGLRPLVALERPAPTLWLDTTVADYTTGKWRPKWAEKALRKYGRSIRIRGLQGDIGFAAAERLLHSFNVPTKPAQTRRWLILDLERVGSIHPAGLAIFEAMKADLREVGMTVVVVDPDRRGLLPGCREFRWLNAAVESCEEALLKDLS